MKNVLIDAFVNIITIANNEENQCIIGQGIVGVGI
jgi:hypothetical protein